MKTQTNMFQKFKAINRELDRFKVAFAEKPEVLAAKTIFSSNNDKIGETLSQLLRPVSTVRSQLQDSENRMRKTLSQMIGIGLTLAISQDNQPMIALLKTYNRQWKRGPAYKLHEIALHVYDELSKLQELAAGNGLSEEKLAAYQQKVQTYSETIDSTGFQLSDRRKSREDLDDLIKTNNQLLRFQLDTFVRFVEEEYPELFHNYMFLRKRKSSKQKPDTTTEPVEITGTVTDSVTGLPVGNATINIVDFNMITTTDADGCYALDELEAGTYLVHCFASNYLVPDAVTLTAEAGESLVVDFSLIPAVADEPATT